MPKDPLDLGGCHLHLFCRHPDGPTIVVHRFTQLLSLFLRSSLYLHAGTGFGALRVVLDHSEAVSFALGVSRGLQALMSL